MLVVQLMWHDRNAQGAAADGGRGPKKLSDIKVDPTIAASLGALPLPAAPQAAAPPNPTAGSGRTAAPAAPATVLDLLGGLESPPARAGVAGAGAHGTSSLASKGCCICRAWQSE